MMTVSEVSKLTGVSIRTLQYYDTIGLLRPTERTQSGYRLYDDTALGQLQQILLFRELEFSLREIKKILSSPHFDRRKALDQQIALLTLRRERLENLITFARGIQTNGENAMNFTAFGTAKQDEYAKRVRAQWGSTPAYTEFTAKSSERSRETEYALGQGLLLIFAEFGAMKERSPASSEAQALVKKLQSYITERYYTCTPEILDSLSNLYTTEEFAVNINAAGGRGTAQFVAEAIHVYCQ